MLSSLKKRSKKSHNTCPWDAINAPRHVLAVSNYPWEGSLSRASCSCTQGRPKNPKKANIGVEYRGRPRVKNSKKHHPGLICLHRSVYLHQKHERITEESAWNSFCAGQDTPRDAKSKHFAKDILKKTMSHA